MALKTLINMRFLDFVVVCLFIAECSDWLSFSSYRGGRFWANSTQTRIDAHRHALWSAFPISLPAVLDLVPNLAVCDLTDGVTRF